MLLWGSISLASCQEISNKDYQITTEVRDDNNKPIQGAIVETSSDILIPESSIPLSKRIRINALTDQNGISKISFSSIQTPRGVLISKEGYYSFTSDTNWEQPFDFAGTRTANVQAVLRPIKNPIPMIARANSGFEIKELDVNYQFDLEVGQLLPPYGEGVHPDIRVNVKGSRIDHGPNEYEDIEYLASIHFSNPLDGFVEFAIQPKDGAIGSLFVSDYLAPDSGYDQNVERKGVWGKVRESPEYWEYLRGLERKAYYFRVRTKTDVDGKIISANYGKIYGPLILSPVLKNHAAFKKSVNAKFSFGEVYFNPTPNDRNVEFDARRNLSPNGNVQRP